VAIEAIKDDRTLQEIATQYMAYRSVWTGVNRGLDNIYIERFCRTLKYEDIYLNDFLTAIELKTGMKRYMAFSNGECFHASQDYQTPNEVYTRKFQEKENKELLDA
jgi:hypothetical protein